MTSLSTPSSPLSFSPFSCDEFPLSLSDSSSDSDEEEEEIQSQHLSEEFKNVEESIESGLEELNEENDIEENEEEEENENEEDHAHHFSSSHSPLISSSRVVSLLASPFPHRPPTLYFDYPLSFGFSRSIRHPTQSQAKTIPTAFQHYKLLNTFKIADSACVYNSVTGTLKRSGMTEIPPEHKKFLLRWGKQTNKSL
jgi:hypothetical protein